MRLHCSDLLLQAEVEFGVYYLDGGRLPLLSLRVEEWTLQEFLDKLGVRRAWC